MNEEEKGGGTEEVANEMASLEIAEDLKRTTTMATTNDGGGRSNESPPYKTRGDQKEGSGSKTSMRNQEESNEVRADSKPHAKNDEQDGKEKGEGNNEAKEAGRQLEGKNWQEIPRALRREHFQPMLIARRKTTPVET